MNRLLAIIALALLLVCCNVPHRIIKDPVRLEAVQKVAVLPFNCSEKETGYVISEALAAGLLRSRFIVLERSQVDRLLTEQGFSAGDYAESYSAALGRLKGVDAVIVGTATIDRETCSSPPWVIECTARMVDLVSGEIIMATSFTPAMRKNKELPAAYATEVGEALAAGFFVE
jgi:hypothetical protein